MLQQLNLSEFDPDSFLIFYLLNRRVGASALAGKWASPGACAP